MHEAPFCEKSFHQFADAVIDVAMQQHAIAGRERLENGHRRGHAGAERDGLIAAFERGDAGFERIAIGGRGANVGVLTGEFPVGIALESCRGVERRSDGSGRRIDGAAGMDALRLKTWHGLHYLALSTVSFPAASVTVSTRPSANRTLCRPATGDRRTTRNALPSFQSISTSTAARAWSPFTEPVGHVFGSAGRMPISPAWLWSSISAMPAVPPKFPSI